MTCGAVVRTASQGRTAAVVGDVYRFPATGDDTNGKYAVPWYRPSYATTNDSVTSAKSQ